MRKKLRFDVERFVAAEPETVFATVADIPDWPSVLTSVEAIEILTPGPLRPGTRFRETRTMFGRTSTQEMEIVATRSFPVEIEIPNRLRIASQNPDLLYELDHIIDAVEGGSRLMLVFRSKAISLAGEGLLPLASPFLEIRLRDELEQDLHEFASAVPVTVTARRRFDGKDDEEES